MAEHYKLFQHDGDRNEITDQLAEELAAHALRDAHPGIQGITYTWVHHNQPDTWLLFAQGTTEDT